MSLLPVQSQQARQAVTRQDLIAFGQSGRPWQFVPVAVRALAQVPGDAGLRFLLAVNLARLGLRTLAGETLGELPESAQGEPDVVALAGAIEGLGDDRVPAWERRGFALGNLRALRAKGLDTDGVLSLAFEAWSDQEEGVECFRAVDGNLVRRSVSGSDWTSGFIDQRSAAAVFCEKHCDEVEVLPRPLAIEGLDPPWLFEAAWRLQPRTRVGYAPPITVLQADAVEFFEGLSAMDLREALVDPRVSVYVGRDASQRWLNDAIGRIDEVVLGMVIATPGERARLVPPAEAVTGRASAAQAAEARRLQGLVVAAYEKRDKAWWGERYAEAQRGGKPLRVLVPTSRYSTFVQHAARDLAEAFEVLGCEARVFAEAGPSSRPSTVGYLRSVAEFEPDLIALVNYFRGDAGLPYPDQVPWLCWVQDAMKHQFAARRWSELDFVAGHVHKELKAQEGFPQRRSMPFPVVASTRKFFSTPVEGGLRDRFACEVAYVSHQSETAGVFHARYMEQAGDDGMARLLDELRPLVEAEAVEPMGTSLLGRLERLTREVLKRCYGSVDESCVCDTFRQYALPLADRVLRHQTLGWAAEVCERRGWRFRLYGRGWEEHPELGRYACGELAHGEELRACYQSAAIHLHASVSTLVHQRVMECALSGGLPIARLTHNAVAQCMGVATRKTLLEREPCERDAATGDIGFRVSACPALAEIDVLCKRVGEPYHEIVWVSPDRVASFREPDHPSGNGLDAGWLYGDLAEMTIRSAADLEGLVERAVEDGAWRRGASEAMAARVRERCTMDVFAKKMLTMITGSLTGSETNPSAT